MAASNSDSDFESPKVVSSSKKSVVGNLSSTRKKQLARKKTKLPPRIAKTPLNVDDSSYSLVLCGDWKTSNKIFSFRGDSNWLGFSKCHNRDILGGWCDSGSIFVADVIAKHSEIDESFVN